MNKISRYDIYAYGAHSDSFAHWAVQPYKKGEFVYAEDIAQFINQFQKEHNFCTMLLNALGEQDAT